MAKEQQDHAYNFKIVNLFSEKHKLFFESFFNPIMIKTTMKEFNMEPAQFVCTFRSVATQIDRIQKEMSVSLFYYVSHCNMSIFSLSTVALLFFTNRIIYLIVDIYYLPRYYHSCTILPFLNCMHLLICFENSNKIQLQFQYYAYQFTASTQYFLIMTTEHIEKTIGFIEISPISNLAHK